MSTQPWKDAILKVIDESYDGTGGIYLDSATDTLAELRALSGAQASTMIPGAGNSVANQVKHLITSAKMHEIMLAGEAFPELDWGADWAESTLTDDEWQDLLNHYAASRDALKRQVNAIADDNDAVAEGAVMLASHLPYHIGQIRHAAAYAKHQ